MCVFSSLSPRFLERGRDQHSLREIKREREVGGEIGKHGSNSEKRSRNRDEEVVEDEGSGIEGTCERYR